MSELVFMDRKVVGPLQCNCILLACARTKEGVLIDPGDEASRLAEWVESKGIKVKYLLHTHAHFDHVGATAALRKRWNTSVCLHAGDEILLKNLSQQGRMFGVPLEDGPPVEKFLENDEILTFGDQKLEVRHTPGHSPGGVCFRLMGGDEQLYSGDSLFKQSIGRTDLWGGDTELLLRSIRDRIFTLEDDMPVHPGHGPSTNVGVEKRNNPFFN